MPLVWRDQMSVGNNQIDEEHKYLIEQINAVQLAFDSEHNNDVLTATLAHLVKYTKIHFEHAEAIQRKINYPESDIQHSQHRQIIEELQVIQKQLEEILTGATVNIGSPTPGEQAESEHRLDDEIQASASKEELQPLLHLTRNWIVDHVIGSDLKMKPYLTKHSPDLK